MITEGLWDPEGLGGGSGSCMISEELGLDGGSGADGEDLGRAVAASLPF